MLKNNVLLPVPNNISIWWNFGSLLGLVLSAQLLTGLFLAIHYTPHIDLAFCAVAHIVRDVNSGWFLRSLHANGASFFFLCIYAHIGRGLYYGSYSYKGTWMSGVLLLIMVIATAFLGYVLPWGQMRFWGATVITNLFRALPYVGGDIVRWLWGGFSVQNATLSRFYVLHFLLPIIAVGVVLIHLLLLHNTGRNNPLGIDSSSEKVPFHCYFTLKDLVGFIVFFFLVIRLVFFYPTFFLEPDNFILADPLITPTHIVPEWYFLFAYAILRSIPNKLGGVIGLFSSILLLLFLPLLNKYMLKGNTFYPIRKYLHWSFFLSFIILTFGGAWPVEVPYIHVRQVFSTIYFLFFLSFPTRSFIDVLF